MILELFMARQDLVTYLREGVKRGFSLDLLEENLTKEGWPRQLVIEASNLIRSERKETIKKLPVTEVDFNLDIPLGIRIIAVLHYLSALGIILFGVYSAFVFDIFSLSTEIQSSNLPYIILGISILIALVPFLLGIGIRRASKLARIIFTFFTVISIFLALYYSLSLGVFEKVYLISIIIPLGITVYLFFNKKSRRHFG